MTRPAMSLLASALGKSADLAEMIDSVREQTSPDWELIVADDGASAAVLARYAEDARIRTVSVLDNGLGPAIDAAAAAATGPFYAVVHGDGKIVPSFCERVTGLLAARPEIDALVVDALPFDADGDRSTSFHRLVGVTHEPGIGHRVTLAEVIGGRVLYSTAAIREQAWKAGGGYTCDTPPLESLAMDLRMLAAGCDLRVLPEPLARYRVHGEALHDAPEDQAAYDDAVERAYLGVGDLTSDPDALAALDARLGTLRYEKAMRHARDALGAGDTAAALAHTRVALGQRRAPKPLVIAGVLTVAPGLLRRVQLTKQQVGTLVRRAKALAGR